MKKVALLSLGAAGPVHAQTGTGAVDWLLGLFRALAQIIVIGLNIFVVIMFVAIVFGIPAFVFFFAKKQAEREQENTTKAIVWGIIALVGGVIAGYLANESIIKPYINEQGILGVLNRIAGG